MPIPFAAATAPTRRVIVRLARTATTIALAWPFLSMASLPAAGQAPDAGTSPAPTAVPPGPPLPFADAIIQAARQLFKSVSLPAGGGKVEIVIDPLIDGKTGLHTVDAAEAGRRLAALARSEFPRLTIVDFTLDALARNPLVLLGTITALDEVGQDTAEKPAPNATRPGVSPAPVLVWFTLADPRTRTVVAKGKALASADGINTLPTLAQADSPAWSWDAAVAAYIESCHQTTVGGPLPASYADAIPVSAVIAEADQAYAAGRVQKALGLYRKALAMPGGRQMRVFNGIYVALVRLQKKDEAAEAFGRLVDYGLESRDLAVKILFRPGTAQFVKSRDAAAYPMWLRQIAAKTTARKACLEIVGHTGPTGPAAENDRLSQLRAQTIRTALDAASRGLGEHIVARGAGARETIVGTGKDDATDALDRRVEFKVVTCP